MLFFRLLICLLAYSCTCDPLLTGLNMENDTLAVEKGERNLLSHLHEDNINIQMNLTFNVFLIEMDDDEFKINLPRRALKEIRNSILDIKIKNQIGINVQKVKTPMQHKGSFYTRKNGERTIRNSQTIEDVVSPIKTSLFKT